MLAKLVERAISLACVAIIACLLYKESEYVNESVLPVEVFFSVDSYIGWREASPRASKIPGQLSPVLQPRLSI